MKKMFVLGTALAIASSASAAPNVTNVTQKGSLLVFADIRVDLPTVGDLPVQPPEGQWNTLIRIQNDGSSDVDLKCYWLDGFKNRVDFIIPLSRNQAAWFEAGSGAGTYQVNPFPRGQANGFTAGNRHPFLDRVHNTNTLATGANGQAGSAFVAPVGDGYGPYQKGALVCWAVDSGARNQVKWNHLSGTATLYNANGRHYEYSAYAFYAPQGQDLQPIGTPGSLELNGVVYDSCPAYGIGQFTPASYSGFGFGTSFGNGTAPTVPPPTNRPPAPTISFNRLAVVGCHLDLNQDWVARWTKLQFDVWNEDEVKFTGAYECADSWHETDFRSGSLFQGNLSLNQTVGFVDGIDSAGQNFTFAALGTYEARYRVNGAASTQCNRTKAASNDTVSSVTTINVGILPVQSTTTVAGQTFGTSLAVSGKMSGRIFWDPEGEVPEGGVR